MHTNMRIVVFLLVFSLAQSSISRSKPKRTCGYKNYNSQYPTPRLHMVGAEYPSAPHEWPWMMRLDIEYPQGSSQCAGVLVQACNSTADSDTVLTAARCVTYVNKNTKKLTVLEPEAVKVYAGFHSWKKVAAGVKNPNTVERIVIHGDFLNGGILGDVAILKLKTPLKESRGVNPICLPLGMRGSGEMPYGPRFLCYVAGWGLSNSDAPDLRHGRHVIMRPEECREKQLKGNPKGTVSNDLYSKYYFCSRPFNKREFATPEDLGGPLMCKDRKTEAWILQGIISTGVKDQSGSTILNNHASMHTYSGWVSENIQRDSSVCSKCGKKKECSWSKFV